MDLLSPLNYWHWWILAVLLAVAEVFAPGIYLIWLGIAAAITGAVALAVSGMVWESQVMIFGLLSMISALGGRVLYRRTCKVSDHPTLNRRAAQYIGQVFTLDQAIVNGTGRLRVSDSMWKVSGPDSPAGTRVRVVSADGVVLQVEPAETAIALPPAGDV